jgi:intracellular septation protein
MITRGFIDSCIIEFGPVLLFFAVAKAYGIFYGAVALVISTILALIWSLIRDGRIPTFSVLSSTFVLVCGTATIISNDPYWIVLEYTAYNGLFGIALLIGILFKKPLLKPLFEGMFQITDHGWLILSARWAFFFIITAIGNEYVWRYMGEDPWVHFRLFAALVLCVFGFSQFFLARKHRLPHSSPWGLRI